MLLMNLGKYNAKGELVDEESYDVPICPVCKEECEEVFKTVHDNEIVGCNNCIEDFIKRYDAWEQEECFG